MESIISFEVSSQKIYLGASLVLMDRLKRVPFSWPKIDQILGQNILFRMNIYHTLDLLPLPSIIMHYLEKVAPRKRKQIHQILLFNHIKHRQ